MLIKILSRVNSLILAVFSTLFILVSSLVNQVPQPADITVIDKFGHLVAYLFLTFFWLIFATYSTKNKTNLLLVAIACIFYGIVIELLQHALTSTRTASVLDVIANTLGVFIAYFLVFVVKIKVKN